MHFLSLQAVSRLRFLGVASILLAAGCGDGTPVGAVEGPAMPTAPPAQTNWTTYQDPITGFTVQYPPEYVVMPEPRPLPDSTPGLVQRVRFQDKQVAAGQLADVEPPKFRVEVFDAPTAGSLRTWLDANNRLASGAVVQTVAAPQTREAARVTTPLLLAPNVFYYYLTARYVFLVVPLGPFTDDMLASFRVP